MFLTASSVRCQLVTAITADDCYRTKLQSFMYGKFKQMKKETRPDIELLSQLEDTAWVELHVNTCKNSLVLYTPTSDNSAWKMQSIMLTRCWLIDTELRQSSQAVSWLVQSTEPSQPITWLILTKLNMTTTKNNTENNKLQMCTNKSKQESLAKAR